MGLLDLLDSLNFIERLAGAASGVLHADWRGAARHGAGGIAGELLQTAAGTNAWTFRVPTAAGWTGQSIERFLRHYGIAIWNRGVGDQELHFCVEKRQANWAEYLLLRRGIPVTSAPFNERNAAYGARHAPGDRPPAWADRASSGGVFDKFLDLF